MHVMDRVGEVDFGIPEEAELEAMSCLLAEEFSHFEPAAVALGIPCSQVRSQVEAFGQKAVSEQLTVIARQRNTHGILGALVTEDFFTPLTTDTQMAAPAFAPLGALLEGLDDQYRKVHTIEAGTHLHLFMLGVAAHATGRGVASRLVTTCLNNGRSRGYRTAVTEATGIVSQHIFRKLGFREMFVGSYQKFEFNGQRVFASIRETEGVILMARDL